MAMHAKTIEEATHRYVTNICWGEGYFKDGYRYIIAKSDEDALEFIPAIISEETIQRKSSDHKWEYIE